MKPIFGNKIAVLASLLTPLSVIAGEFDDISMHKQPVVDDPVYEAGRGLITLEGPSGMFINPTSATLPAGSATIQYCMFLPDRSTDIVGNGFFGAYGVTDAFEIGAIGKYIDPEGASGFGGAGPFARLRLMKHDGIVPQLSVGGYAQFGDDPLNIYSIFSAAYWRIPIADESGFVKSVGVHTGVRANWYDLGPSDSVHGYGGLEVQLPLRVYLVGEVSTRDTDIDTENVPYAFGAQWRLYGINLTAAGIQNGSIEGGPAFYWGIGAGWQF